MNGEIEGADLKRRLEPFGLDERVAVLVVEHGSGGRGSANRVEAALGEALRAQALAGLIATAGPLVCALVPGFDDDDLFAIGERVAERLEGDLGQTVVLGVGRAVPGDQARRAYHEARCTLEAITMVQGHRSSGPANGSVNGSPARAAASAGTGSVGVTRVATYRDSVHFSSSSRSRTMRHSSSSATDPRPDRGQRGAVRRRADALARSVHRRERPVGARRKAALLPPAHVEIQDPARGGADGA